MNTKTNEQRAADAAANKQLLADANKKVADVNAEITQNGLLHISFGASGNTVTIDPTALSDAIRQQATLHGLKQKLVDAAAIARDTATGRSATSADKEAAVMEVFNRITSANGTWNKVREAGATAVGGLLVAALMQMTGKTKPEIVKYLEAKTSEEKTALRKNPKVATIILELQQAASNPNIDSDALLADLMPGVQEVAEETLGDDLKHTDGEPTDPKPAPKRAKKDAHPAH